MTKTTFEMDGLLTQEDIDNRHFIMGQCLACNEWSKWDTRQGRWQCTHCLSQKYNMREARSIRTWLTTKDLKRAKTGRKKY